MAIYGSAPGAMELQCITLHEIRTPTLRMIRKNPVVLAVIMPGVSLRTETKTFGSVRTMGGLIYLIQEIIRLLNSGIVKKTLRQSAATKSIPFLKTGPEGSGSGLTEGG